MATFIEEVASQLYDKYGDDVSSLTMVLPSKRARLFFAEALSKVACRPIWEPNYTSIDDLMCQLSALRKADRLRLIAELHNVYNEYHNEDFDEFYHWGEVLLSDFDMIDKYRVDAVQLFTNISDLKELDSYMGADFTPEQIEMINRFWRTLAGEQNKTIDANSARGRFLSVWHSLGAIYEKYRARLRELGVGYTGMIYREATNRLSEGRVELSDNERYIFVGFNALSECEKMLLEYLQTNARAEFYWDYDRYYTDNKYQEAGMFIRENIAHFPSNAEISNNNLCNIESINVLSTSSNVAQCQCVVDILERIASKNNGVLGKDTAVVLTDESLLMPLLYALPEKFKVRHEMKGGRMVTTPAVNVTMGYPLRNTLAYSFVERLLELQKHADTNKAGETTFYYVDVDGLLAHPYIADVSTAQYSKLRSDIIEQRLFQVPVSMLATTPFLQKIFCKASEWRGLSEYLLTVIDAVSESAGAGEESSYRAEFLSITYDALARLQNVVSQCGKDISEKIYYSLVRRHLQAERVPFTGEPLEGLQIMGILETRNLDFKNVILLSMTDNNFPGSRATDKSFLPYGLRYGFNIPTATHHEGVYAYYFYRLIERAENLYMLYSSAADDKSTGEPSRYIRQIEYETDFKINYTNVGVEVSLSDGCDIVVDKDVEVFDKLLRFTRDKGLSPTAFSTYVKCPLKFYFNVVERLRPEDELDESVDNLTFGNIFHESADLLYQQVQDADDPASKLIALRDAGEVERCVDQAIAKIYYGNKDGVLKHELGGELLIIRNIVRAYLKSNLLDYDIRNYREKGERFKVYKTEYDLSTILPIKVGDKEYNVNLAGRADRVDLLNDNMWRVIDYKTGKPRLNYSGIESLFHGEPIATKRESNIINTLLYALMLNRMHDKDIRPELYYVGSMVHKDYSSLFVESIDRKSRNLEAYSEVAEEFEAEVVSTLQEMFDKSIPFKQCEDDSACKYCDYNTICNRK